MPLTKETTVWDVEILVPKLSPLSTDQFAEPGGRRGTNIMEGFPKLSLGLTSPERRAGPFAADSRMGPRPSGETP